MTATDAEMDRERTEALASILDCENRLQVVVAGPGTGKTYTFKQLLSARGGKGLALTFLNVLAADLDESLQGLASSYSFHGFARHILHQQKVTGLTTDFSYYPPLACIYVEDLAVLDGVTLDALSLGALFRALADTSPLLTRTLAAGSYYDAVSHDDSVYRLLRHLESRPDKVPVYNQVVVDEYQDFCPLEVAVIKVLAQASPVLIAGDDDQALYAFRDASPEPIRSLAVHPDYERFELPYCTRCTAVLVAATHTVVTQAQTAGLLDGRLDKRYECYMPGKRAESAQYPQILHAHTTVQNKKAPYLGRYIEARIRNLSPEDIAESHAEGWPTVMIIAPNPFKKQVEEYLKPLFPQMESALKIDSEPDLLDGYRRLVDDANSRLGWRILVHCLLPDGWEDIIRRCLDGGEEISDALDPTFRAQHLEIADLLRRWLADETLEADELDDLASALEVTPVGLADRINPPIEPAPEVDTTEPSIIVTSLMGSKGLQAGHVFVVGFNEGHFPHDNSSPTNEEVCQLLVALTRGRKSCTVMSTGRLGAKPLARSVFLTWLQPHLSPIYVNKTFLDGAT
jgi:hypothetical protein